MDIEGQSPQLVGREFLAIVIAGFGNGLLPLTSSNGDEPCPKALLSVGNRPIIDYTLSWLEQSGIKDVLLICPSIHRPAIYQHIHSDIPSSPSSLRIDLQTYDESSDSPAGTCSLLRYFSNRITEDFIILPCDFLPPASLPLMKLLNKFRSESISDDLIATTCWYFCDKSDKNAVPEDWSTPARPVSIAWDDQSGTLLYIDTADDIDRNAEELELKMTMLTRYPRLRLSSKYQDSHLYVCRRSVLLALQEKPQFVSFREELLPWLCKIQYQRAKREKYQNVFDQVNPQSLSLKHSTLIPHHTKRLHKAEYDESEHPRDLIISVPSSPIPSDDSKCLLATVRIGIILHHVEGDIATRVNTLPDFVAVNRRILSQAAYTLPTDPKNRSLIDLRAQISPDNIIGESTRIAERATIKKSVIGRHCVIGKMTKIVGCILLDHCVVEDGAKLDGCVLGKNTKVGAKAEVQRCLTQPGYEIAPGETLRGEKLELSDWTAGVRRETEHEESDDEHV